MRISTFGYVGKQGVKNIWRNKMFSLASIATMSACIFLFGLFFSIIVNFQHIIKTAEEGVAITVFFEEDATDSEIESDREGAGSPQRCGRSKVHIGRRSMGRIPEASILQTIRSWQKDLKTITRWHLRTTMKYI